VLVLWYTLLNTLFVLIFSKIYVSLLLGSKRIADDIALMLNKKLNKFWIICFKFITPILAIVITAISIASNTEVMLGVYRYPQWAHAIGWLD
jgi:hypothetical protein